MTIDPAKPCEARINGRYQPVMLLFALGNDTPLGFYVQVGDDHCMFGMNDPEAHTLRNVPTPNPEPVLREAWVVWDGSGDATWLLPLENSAKRQAEKHGGVYARAAVMSDGSPVPGRAKFESDLDRAFLIADRNHWKAEASRIQNLWDADHEMLISRYAGLLAEVQAMRPVVEAAVEVVNEGAGTRHWLQVVSDVRDAVRTYQCRAPATSPNRDAYVGDMIAMQKETRHD